MGANLLLYFVTVRVVESKLMRIGLFFIFCVAAMAQSPAKVAQGSYECWAHGSPRLLLNFSIRAEGKYTGSDNKPGTYSYDAKTGRIAFKGGALDGVMPEGFYTIYHEPHGKPTVSFRGRSGSEASFCEKAR